MNLLPVGNYPYDVTYTPNGKQVWFAGNSGDGVVVLDADTGSILTGLTLPSGDYGIDVEFSTNGATAYFSARDSVAITPIDTATFTPGAPIAMPDDPGKMVVSPCDGKLYVVEWYGSELFVVDPATKNVTSHPIGTSLWDLALSHDGKTLYINDRGNDSLRVVDVATKTLTTSIPTCDDPWGIDLTPDGSTLVITCEDSHEVAFVDIATQVVTKLSLGSSADPRDVEIDTTGTKAYVPTGDLPGTNVDGIFVIDIATKSLVDTLVFQGSGNSNVVAIAPAPTVCVP